MQGSPDNDLAAQGVWGSVHWARDRRGRCPARDFFELQTEEDQAKLLALFKHLAEFGQIRNEEKFKKLKGVELFEFKSFQLRFYGNFRPGKRFLIALGVRKKKDKSNPTDFKIAVRILEESENE